MWFPESNPVLWSPGFDSGESNPIHVNIEDNVPTNWRRSDILWVNSRISLYDVVPRP